MNKTKYGVAIFNHKQMMQIAAYCFMKKLTYEYTAHTGVAWFNTQENADLIRKVILK